MVRMMLVFAALVGTVGMARATVPVSHPGDSPAQSSPDRSYVVFFTDGKATLTPQAREVLHTAARQAHAMRQAKVRVILPRDFNGAWALLQNRARAVKTELVRDGVKARSIGNAIQPVNDAYTNSEPGLRTWRDRSTIVEVVPLPNTYSDGQVG
jgi:hypothetical protein